MKKNRVPKTLALATAIALTASCMGSFTLTKKLYAFNETITGDKIINNVIFWALNILPIYEFAVLGDAFILNVIEFWTGNNLLADAGSDGDTRVAVVENADGSLTVTRNGKTLTLIPDGENRVKVVLDDTVIGVAERGADGSIVAKNAAGLQLAAVSAAEAAQSEALVQGALAPAL